MLVYEHNGHMYLLLSLSKVNLFGVDLIFVQPVDFTVPQNIVRAGS